MGVVKNESKKKAAVELIVRLKYKNIQRNSGIKRQILFDLYSTAAFKGAICIRVRKYTKIKALPLN